MNAFKIDKSKIEALNTRYEEKAKELTSLAKERDKQLEKIGSYISTACCEIEDNKKETGITNLFTVLSMEDITTVDGAKLSSDLSINIDIDPETDYYQMSPRMKTDLHIQAMNYIGCPEETLPLFTQNEKEKTHFRTSWLQAKSLPKYAVESVLAYLANNNDKICEQIGHALSEKIEQQMENRITDVKNKIEIISDKNKEELDVALDWE